MLKIIDSSLLSTLIYFYMFPGHLLVACAYLYINCLLSLSKSCFFFTHRRGLKRYILRCFCSPMEKVSYDSIVLTFFIEFGADLWLFVKSGFSEC